VIGIKNLSKRAAEKKSVLVPFGFKYRPLKKLALINFEEDPDKEYMGLEPQYFSGSKTGQGFRVIAYRNDGFVDVYDDFNLQDDNQASFDVAGKGLKERKKVRMEDAVFEKDGDRLNLSFQFADKYERKITLEIREKTKKKTSGLNLLAPVGSSTAKPSYLPLFFLYSFDFIRKNKTDINLTIDGKTHRIDAFPYRIPKDFQWRYYTRYSQDCQIIEFASAGQKILDEHELVNNSLTISDNKFLFTAEGSLKKMEHISEEHHFSAEFSPEIPDIRKLAGENSYTGSINIKPDSAMGSISGEYWLGKKDEIVEIEMNMSDGWSPVPDSLFTRLMFGKKSLFCSWPKYYFYKQKIDLSTLESSSFWENKNINRIE